MLAAGEAETQGGIATACMLSCPLELPMHHATSRVLPALISGMLAVPAMAQTPRPFEDEVVYQIMPIAWRDSNNDMQGATQTRFGDVGGLASTASLC